MKRIQNETFYQLLLILVMGTVVFLLIPFHTNPMRFNSILEERTMWSFPFLHYADIDGDGRDDQILGFWNSGKNTYGIQMLGSNGGVGGQWNIVMDSAQNRPTIFVGDYNNDQQSEIYVYYLREGLIFLNIIFPACDSLTQYFSSLWVDSVMTMPTFPKELECYPPVFGDLNADGENEIIFSVFSKFGTYYPRRLYAYDMVKQRFIRSKPYGNMICNLLIFDFEGDGKLEITGTCGSPDNNKPGYEFPLSDSCAWLMVFDENLELKDSTPYQFPGQLGSCNLFYMNDKNQIFGLWKHVGNYSDPAFFFKVLDPSAIEIIDTIPNFDGMINMEFRQLADNQQNRLIGISGNRNLFTVNHHFQIEKKITIHKMLDLRTPLDLNGDGKTEITTTEKNANRILVYNQNLREQLDYSIKHDSPFRLGTTNFLDEHLAYIQTNMGIEYFRYVKNPWHFLKWLTLIGIFGVIYFFTWFILFTQRRAQNKKDILAQKIRKLELASIKSQLDPHFAFNALNVLNYLSSTGDQAGVEKFTHHYSRMLRRQLESSDKPAITLFEELDFVSHYMELQKLRYDIPIAYYADVDSSVDQNILIPKMLIHTHVENAIKHGILPKGSGGTITVTIEQKNRSVRIYIKDDGAGKSKIPNNHSFDSTGKGLQILDQMIDLFYQLVRVKIRQEFVDLKDADGNPAGTEVRIVIM